MTLFVLRLAYVIEARLHLSRVLQNFFALLSGRKIFGASPLSRLAGCDVWQLSRKRKRMCLRAHYKRHRE